MDNLYQDMDIYKVYLDTDTTPYPYIDTSLHKILPYVSTNRLTLNDIPNLLYYKLYDNDRLWHPNHGLLTRRKIVGIPLNSHFFQEKITQHLSFPVDAPWFFSFYISVTASYVNMNKIVISLGFLSRLLMIGIWMCGHGNGGGRWMRSIGYLL